MLHPKKSQFNLYITTFKRQVDSVIESLSTKDMSASDIKKRVEQALDPEEEEEENAVDRTTRFAYRFLQFAHSKSKSTCGVYMQTYRRMVAFMGEDALNEMQFEDVTKNWLVSFENFMAETAGKNARNIHLRNIRAVVNDAIDDEITSTYAFRRFKIRPEATKKRSLPVEKLRMLFNFQPEAYAQKYLDMFKLIFMLIGINVADLANLKRIEDGRIEYRRKKTHRLYSVKVEPEALELIDRLAGENWLVYIRDKYNDHNEYTRRINRELKKLGEVKRSGLGGKKTRKPLFPELTTYWARHSWATIAASLDIPKDVIAHALGHGGNTVTDIYIDFDQSKVDEANRKVLDWVLYGKK
ncbi:MAG: phage integrase SAM-like domain-containing protein [Bacteroidales bacterium]|nr:phage integrase SAM-like domain-containing protein [Bacteroidales bacterium]